MHRGQEEELEGEGGMGSLSGRGMGRVLGEEAFAIGFYLQRPQSI